MLAKTRIHEPCGTVRFRHKSPQVPSTTLTSQFARPRGGAKCRLRGSGAAVGRASRAARAESDDDTTLLVSAIYVPMRIDYALERIAAIDDRREPACHGKFPEQVNVLGPLGCWAGDDSLATR